MSVLKALENALKILTVTEGVTRVVETNEEESGDAMSEKNQSGTVIEEIELEAKYLVNRVKELLHEGNIRKLIIRDSKGKYLLEIPMTFGVVAGGIFVLYAPALTALSVVAAAVTNVKIEVVRTDEESGEDDEDDADDD